MLSVVSEQCLLTGVLALYGASAALGLDRADVLRDDALALIDEVDVPGLHLYGSDLDLLQRVPSAPS